MRILMLTQSYAPIVGGVERVVEDLSGELARRGHEVGVATLRQPEGGEVDSIDGVAVHHLDGTTYRLPGVGIDKERRHSPPFPDPETVVALRRLLRRERPEIVHAHNWIVHSYLPLARRSGAALAMSLHDYGLVCATKRFLNRGDVCSGPAMGKCIDCAGDYYNRLKGPPVAVATRLAEPHLRHSVDVFLPVSNAVRTLCGLERSYRTTVVPNFIRELPPAPAVNHPQLELLPRGPFILYFGDVTVDKGADLLVRAYGDLTDPPPLVLVGRDYLPELGEAPGVVSLGPMSHPVAMEALRRSLFSVVPSILPETFGLAALEAAAAGKPIVAARSGGLTDIVENGVTGLVVPPGDRGALTAGLQTLLGDAELRDRLGAAALERSRQFSPDQVLPRVEGAYAEALERRRHRSEY